MTGVQTCALPIYVVSQSRYRLQNAELDRLNYAEDKRLRREQAGINRENKKNRCRKYKGLTTLHREITLRIERMPDSSGGFFTGGVYVSVSVDYGYVWSDEQYLPLDGLETFMEKKLAIHMRGKAIRFRVTEKEQNFTKARKGYIYMASSGRQRAPQKSKKHGDMDG